MKCRKIRAKLTLYSNLIPFINILIAALEIITVSSKTDPVKILNETPMDIQYIWVSSQQPYFIFWILWHGGTNHSYYLQLRCIKIWKINCFAILIKQTHLQYLSPAFQRPLFVNVCLLLMLLTGLNVSSYSPLLVARPRFHLGWSLFLRRRANCISVCLTMSLL